jgi:threonine dehydrogenase-like Zn-dependent dehydrogenase
VSVLASGGFRKQTIEQVCALVERGELDLSGSISHLLALPDAPRALELIRDRSVPTRRVVVTSGSAPAPHPIG